MIYIFHGDDQKASRQALNQLTKNLNNANILRLSPKSIELETINNFLSGTSLLSSQKTLLLDSFFSTTKARNKLVDLIKQNQKSAEIIIWQDKKLTPAQIKTFPGARVSFSDLPNYLWECLNSIRPKNINGFSPLYQKVIDQNLYDLFLYLLKQKLRKQLGSYSSFSKAKLLKTYLLLIELDFQNKSGQLSTPKHLALERIIIRLIST